MLDNKDFRPYCKVSVFDNDAYNLPVDTIFYIENPLKEATNALIKSNRKRIIQTLNEAQHYFPLKFGYIKKQKADSQLKSLYPNIKKYYDYDYNYNNNTADAASNSTRHTFEGCLICHLLPDIDTETTEYKLYIADLAQCPNDNLFQIIKYYSEEISRYNSQTLTTERFENRQTLSTGRFENRQTLTTESVEDYSLQADFCMQEFVSEMPQQRRYGLFTRGIAVGTDEDIYELANRIRKDIQELQRRNGINILMEQLNGEGLKVIQQQIQPKPSRMIIDCRFRILLPDYDVEIKVPTLSKVIYILFLRHTEGIRLKELSDYKDELRQLYLTLSPRTQIQTMNSSIDDLTDAQSGSINQKISRISAAFRENLATELAQPYLITGPRGEKRLIQLDRSLVSLPAELTK